MKQKSTMTLKTLCIICGIIAGASFVIVNIFVNLPYTITNYFNLYDINSVGIAFGTVIVTIWILVSERLLRWDDKISQW